MTITMPRIRISALLALVSLMMAGCAAPWASSPPQGEAVLRSPMCHCRFAYPAAWYASASNGDSSRPTLGLDSYDTSSATNAPAPASFASIGIDWQSDPIGQLYLVATTHHFSPWPAHHLTVSGWPATAFAHWTAPPSQGGIYVKHVYLFVPWYQRDYDLWLQATNPPGHDVSALQRVFTRVLRSLTIVPPNAVP